MAVTRKGYRRIRVDGHAIMEHVHVWQQYHGRPLPVGYQVHHIDGDKLNNSIDNLIALTPTEHKRVHSGCELRDGIWWKPCHICRELKPIDREHWYISPEGWPLYGRCRSCHIRKVSERDARLRRMRRAVQDDPS